MTVYFCLTPIENVNYNIMFFPYSIRQLKRVIHQLGLGRRRRQPLDLGAVADVTEVQFI